MIGDRASNLIEGTYTHAIIFICFSISYLCVFVWDKFLATSLRLASTGGGLYIVYDIVIIMEGLAFAALLLVHNKNFRDKEPTIVRNGPNYVDFHMDGCTSLASSLVDTDDKDKLPQ